MLVAPTSQCVMSDRAMPLNPEDSESHPLRVRPRSLNPALNPAEKSLAPQRTAPRAAVPGQQRAAVVSLEVSDATDRYGP